MLKFLLPLLTLVVFSNSLRADINGDERRITVYFVCSKVFQDQKWKPSLYDKDIQTLKLVERAIGNEVRQKYSARDADKMLVGSLFDAQNTTPKGDPVSACRKVLSTMLEAYQTSGHVLTKD